MLDLRSDTVTKPTGAMRMAMSQAEVGDDQFGEDPTMNFLQERVAELLGKEASLFFPTGVMANQCALRTLTRPGDDIVTSWEPHIVFHETGATAANSGIQMTPVGNRGTFTREDFLAAYNAPGHIVHPPTTVVAIENTHNRAGGVVFPQDDAEKICAAARERNVYSYCDGARLWNAAIASNRSFAELAAPFDLVSVAFSKGLGCPAGSMLAGTKEIITRATRYRRMLGGALRQSGILAAACLHALDHHMEQLHNDHKNAKLIAEKLVASKHIALDLATVQTNMIIFDVKEPAPDAETVVARAERLGVAFFAFGPRTIRLVTHRDITQAQCLEAASLILKAVEA
jgi:threonine aldolase